MGLYAPISMVYWFPRLGSINTFKLALIAFICLSTFIYNAGTKRTTSGVTAFAFLALLAILPSIGLSPFDDLVDYFTNVGIIAAFCLAVSTFDANDHLYKILTNIISFGVVSFALTHIIGSVFFNLDAYIPINEAYTGFADIGFNLSRTGWSASLGLFVPILFLNRSSRQGLLLVIPLILSQYICGGRGGLVASAAATIIILWRRREQALLVSLLFCGLALIQANYDEFTGAMRLDRLDGGANALNSFSAGRIESYVLALEMIQQNWLTGIGYGQMDLSNQIGCEDVHNAFLLLTAELGLFVAPLFFGLFILVRPLLKPTRTSDIAPLAPMVALVLLMSVEPSVLFKSFQNSFGFWSYFFLRHLRP